MRSTRYVDNLPRHVARIVTNEERDGSCDIIRLANPPNGNLCRSRSLKLVEWDSNPLGSGHRHIGCDESWCDCVNGDTILAKLDGKRFRESHKSGLSGRIIRLATVTKCRCAGDVYDSSPLRINHILLSCPAHEESTSQVHVHHRVPVSGRHLEQQIIANNSGVVHQHGWWTKSIRDLIYRSFDSLFIGNIRTYRHAHAARALNFLHRTTTRAFVYVQ